MSTIYWYQGDSTAERVYQVRLGELSGLPTDSRLGQSATGGLIVDDPAGTLRFRPWRRFWVEDDEAPPGDQRVWAGYITHVSVRHGPNRWSTGREWSLTLTDMNNILHHRKIRPTDTGHSRPAETDIERLTWLLATDWADGVLFTDLGLVDTTGPVDVDAQDLAGKYFGDVLADLSNASGKNHCLVPHEAEDHRDLVYAFNSSVLYPSTVSISNVLSDVDWDIVFPPGTQGSEFPDATLEIDGEKDYDGAYVTYKGGAFYRTSVAEPGEVFRDTDIDLPEDSVLATAEATADRELADMDTPDEEIAVSLWLPKTHVTLVKPWHLLPVRLTHLPDYEGYRDTRIVSHVVRQDAPGTDDWYRLDLQLSPLPLAPLYDVTVDVIGDGIGPPDGWPTDTVDLESATTYRWEMEVTRLGAAGGYAWTWQLSSIPGDVTGATLNVFDDGNGWWVVGGPRCNGAACETTEEATGPWFNEGGTASGTFTTPSAGNYPAQLLSCSNAMGPHDGSSQFRWHLIVRAT